MGKLSYLKSGAETQIAPGQSPAVLRDVQRLNASSQVWVFHTDATPAASDGNAASTLSEMVQSGYLTLSAIASAPSAGADLIELTVEKSATGYKLSHANISGGTSDQFAADAYGDTNRKAFSSIADFARLIAVNEVFRDSVAGEVTGDVELIVVDQVNSKIFIGNDATQAQMGNLTAHASVEFDNVPSANFGE